MTKIRVLHLIRPADGGMKNHLLDLLRFTNRKVFQVEVAVPETCSYKTELKEIGVNILTLPLKGKICLQEDWQTIWKLSRYLKRHNITIIHTHGSKAALVGRIAALVAKTPVVLFTVHNSIFYDHWPQFIKRILSFTEKLMSQCTTRIITVSNQLRNQIIEMENIPKEKIITIYNGINTSKFKHSPSRSFLQSLGVPPVGKVVGVVARLATQKGIIHFLKAVSLMKEYQANFVIIGDGPLRESLKKESENLGLKNRVFFAGYRSDVYQIMPVMDIFVLPSETEGLPLTILEAMTAGVPVVATRVGGVTEVVENQKTGLLVQPKDPHSLALAIAQLLEDEKLAKEIAGAAKQLIEEKFTVEKMIDETMDLYQQVLKEKEILSVKYNQQNILLDNG
ncbi:MAG: glycosyltransferase family 4 protein [Firmicutes bacterium]|nr:glycosyltransferase family 4 protein [Bacillota bacterium]